MDKLKKILNELWLILGHRQPALAILALVALAEAIALGLPQISISPEGSAAFVRRLAELRPVLGNKTRLFASLGFLTIRTSLLFRSTLGLLSVLVAANVDRLRESRFQPFQARDTLSRLALCVGGMLIIAGWAAQMLWGWQEAEIVSWPGTAISLPEWNLSVSQPNGPIDIWPEGRYGLYVITRGQRVGIEVIARDDKGETLALLPSVGESPETKLRLAFTPYEPEAFFAIPAAGLVFRLEQMDEEIRAQVYRSASGEMLVEQPMPLTKTATVLQVNGVEATFSRQFLPRYEVVYNPGALFEALGLLLLCIGAFTISITSPSENSTEHKSPQVHRSLRESDA